MPTPSVTPTSQVSPVILSVSRSTDIPAFYAEWFMNRLREGYAVWYNPFNRQPMRVSFDRVKFIVFWSKNPAPLLPHLPELDRRGIRYYFQFTLNDYGKEGFEPNVPPLTQRIATFLQLSARLGKERVIWRFDPLILSPGTTPRQLLTRIWHLGNQLRGCTDKLVFSFADVLAYRKVQQNLLRDTACFTKENVTSAEPSPAQQQELVEGLVKLRDHWHAEGWQLTLATCAEQIDLDAYGIAHNRCIDSELIARLWHNDPELLYYLHTGTLTWDVCMASLSCGLLIDTLLMVNNFRDREQDRASGKRTLVVRLGERFGKYAYLALGILSTAFALWFANGWDVALPLLYLALHIHTWQRMVAIGHGKKLNSILGETSRNMLFMGIMLCATILLP